MTEFQGELLSTLEPLAADAIDKVNAGAALAYAIYHSSAAEVTAMPDRVLKAYMKACDAYEIGAHHRSVKSSDTLHPLQRGGS